MDNMFDLIAASRNAIASARDVVELWRAHKQVSQAQLRKAQIDLDVCLKMYKMQAEACEMKFLMCQLRDLYSDAMRDREVSEELYEMDMMIIRFYYTQMSELIN